MKAFYMSFGGESPGGNLGHLISPAEPLAIEGAPECACCGDATSLLFQLALGEVVPEVPRGTLIQGFQCRDVGEGGMPAVQLVAATSDLMRGLPALPVGYLQREDPEDAGSLTVDQLDRAMSSKVLGLFVHAQDPRLIPQCRRCGGPMALLFQLNEEPGDFNFADRDLVVFFCARSHELELTPLLL